MSLYETIVSFLILFFINKNIFRVHNIYFSNRRHKKCLTTQKNEIKFTLSIQVFISTLKKHKLTIEIKFEEGRNKFY